MSGGKKQSAACGARQWRPGKRPIIAVALLLASIAAAGACAAQEARPADAKPGTPNAPDFSLPDEPAGKADVESENLFGFTEGTDTPAQGEREISAQLSLGFGRRDPAGEDDRGGRFRAFGARLAFQYGLTDDLSAEVAIHAAAHDAKGVPGLSDSFRTAFDGISAEIKYRILERTSDNPFGLALAVEPRWSRVAETTGAREDGFSAETRLLFDARLVPGRLWYATNLAFESGISRDRRTRVTEREALLSWSNALTGRLFHRTYVGVELRYLRQYEGLAARHFVGHALFAGPTLYHELWKGAYVSAAWSIAVAGRARNAAPGEKLDLQHFERNVAFVKLGFEF